MDYKKMTKRQFLNLPGPNIRESEESELYRRTAQAILHKNNEEFIECISSKDFDVNERFDTSYTQRENYLGYALHFRNYAAAKELLRFDELRLTNIDMQEILQTLTLYNKYGLLFSIIKKFEGSISLPGYVNAVVSLDYTKVRKRVRSNS